MGTIRLLSEHLINRIAAGEVVERPAAVLKELMENSLDAGAGRLEIEAAAGGRRLISIADNGCGMSRDDLLLAIERHATSKLSEETDLLNIATLGFRGEAVPSIGAVSRMTIATADADDGAACRIRMSGGKLISVDEVGRERGTTVEVEDLFFNVPARRKFLKSQQTEAAHLLETVYRYALGKTGLRLIYRHNGQEILSISPMEDERSRLAKILGRNAAGSMMDFSRSGGGMELSGFLGSPDVNRSRPSGIYLYVNGRPVKDRLLTRSVLEAYKGRLMGGRYPNAVVYLDIDPRLVDVNVHPAKAEVRFRQPGEVYGVCVDIMSGVLSESLRPTRPAYHYQPDSRPVDYNRDSGYRPPVEVREVARNMDWMERVKPGDARPVFLEPTENAPDSGSLSDSTPNREKDGGMPSGKDENVIPEISESSVGTDGLKPIGQLLRSYILAQGPEGLYIVDQHAAHERIIYEKIRRDLSSGTVPSQTLLIPETFELSPAQAQAIESVLTDFERFGFYLEPFGGRTFVLRAVPGILANKDFSTVVGNILENGELSKPSGGLEELERELLSTLACHAAIKAGEEMTIPEMDRLLIDLSQCENPTNCPHGRPLVFSINRRDIEKRFKRI